MNIQFRHIRAFVAVAKEKSFARASAKLNVSQPALSQTIIQFEENIGFPVFERTTRNVSLTKPGELLLEKALTLSRHIDGFHNEIHQLQQSVHNELRVGYLIGTAVEFIPAIVREFKRRRPEATLHLTEFDFTDSSAGLASGQVDCGIIRPPIDVRDIQIVELTREQCVACLPTGHRLSDKESVVLEDILDEPFVAAPTRGPWRDYWLANDHRIDRPANVVFEAATVESELQAVATEKGISITADSTAKFYARPGVVFKPIIDMPFCSIAIGYRDTSNRLVRDFISVVQNISEAQPVTGLSHGTGTKAP
nr:LysR family transcriptional regulator [Pararhizobium polonicum]